MMQTEGGFIASIIKSVVSGVSAVADLSGGRISNSTKSCFLTPAGSCSIRSWKSELENDEHDIQGLFLTCQPLLPARTKLRSPLNNVSKTRYSTTDDRKERKMTVVKRVHETAASLSWGD